VFTTLARHRGLFGPWLGFALRLMPWGTLPPADTELAILRVAVRCGSDYEWRQHVSLGQRAGLTRAEIERVAEGPEAPGWSARQRALLRATDALVVHRALDDATWDELRPLLSDEQLIELCMLVGQYSMLAGALNTLGVEPESRAIPQLPRR
jgi:alkylhydroperoxidase family enzyme